ncbi:hypothetical protein [Gimesia algae]|uniref:Uncharacterized protein n=1 Tax=Gimesia algae TaxID=2527971 RepID=A0A517V6Z1_9PLAN|nr:hypothetical protein [Gimesia algae]QDT88767.1 hypothetical protein Pan161_03860 [Gimesia algae]
MPLTKEKLLAVVVMIVNGILGAVVGDFSDNRLFEAAFATLFSIPGLVIIWKREVLSKTGLTRGILRDSPPVLLDIIGWFFLLVIPILYVYELSKH